MEHLKNIAIIANELEGRLEVRGLEYSQKIVGGEHGKNFNHIQFVQNIGSVLTHIQFVQKIGSVFIYTEKPDLIAIAQGKVKNIPLFAAHKNSDCMYKITF